MNSVPIYLKSAMLYIIRYNINKSESISCLPDSLNAASSFCLDQRHREDELFLLRPISLKKF